MRIIVLLVALLLGALLIVNQIDNDAQIDVQSLDGESSEPLTLPTRPQDLQEFGNQLENYLDNAETERSNQIEQQTQ